MGRKLGSISSDLFERYIFTLLGFEMPLLNNLVKFTDLCLYFSTLINSLKSG